MTEPLKELVRCIQVTRWREGAEDQEPEVTVVLRKWSPLKLIALTGHIKEIGSLVSEDFSFNKAMSPAEITAMIHDLGERGLRSAAELVAQSVLKPAGLKAEEVLEWDMDDFMAALTAIVEMNLAASTRKNFLGLRAAFAGAISMASAAEVRSAPEPAQATNSKLKVPSGA